MKNESLSVKRKPLDEDLFVLTHCSVHLFQHTRAQYGANLCSTQNNVRFLHGPKTKKNARAQAVASLACAKTTGHTGVPPSRHASTVNKFGDGNTGGNNLRASTECVVVEVKNKEFLPRHTWIQTLCRHSLATPQESHRFCHRASSTKDVEHVLACHPFVAGAFTTVLQSLNTLRACFQHVSEREREREW